MEAITREEMFLAYAAGDTDIQLPEPITRKERFLAYLAGDTSVELPEPITREEHFLYLACQTGGGSGTVVNNQDKTVTENGSYTADSGYTGLGTVTVNVPVKEPAVEPLVVTQNGEYTPGAGVDGFAPVTVEVDVEASGGMDATVSGEKLILSSATVANEVLSIGG